MAHEKFSPDIDDVYNIAMKYHGNIALIADHYQVSRQVIYDYFKREPLGQKVLAFVRDYDKEQFLNIAESITMQNMQNYKNNPHLATRSAEKIIDKLGYLHGWGVDDKGQEHENLNVKHEEVLEYLRQRQLDFSAYSSLSRQAKINIKTE